MHPLKLPKYKEVDDNAGPSDNGIKPVDGAHDAVPYGIDYQQYFNDLTGNIKTTPTTMLLPPRGLVTVSSSCVNVRLNQRKSDIRSHRSFENCM